MKLLGSSIKVLPTLYTPYMETKPKSGFFFLPYNMELLLTYATSWIIKEGMVKILYIGDHHSCAGCN
jgi:hypothetical protein